jgi:hypothetical protein
MFPQLFVVILNFISVKLKIFLKVFQEGSIIETLGRISFLKKVADNQLFVFFCDAIMAIKDFQNYVS